MNESKLGITRRRLIQLSGIAALTAFAAACAPKSEGTPAPTEAPVPTGAAGGDTSPLPGVGTGKGGGKITPTGNGQVAITPNSDFYTVAYNMERPAVPDQWTLTVAGLVKTPLTMTLDDIKKFQVVEEMRTFECISNPVGGTLIGNAVWKAVHFADVLEKAGVEPSARELKLEAFDGYSTGVPLELGLNPKSLLAFEMNGEPLPVEHGFPLRVIWPGRYGMKQPKWLQRITAIDSHYTGYWEGQGWSNDALVLPNSRIDSPGDGDVVKAEGLQIHGVAFADGNDGVATIEVSYDNGKTWQQTTLVRGPNPFVWTNWEWQGTVPAGSVVLLARVTTNAGKTQQKDSVSLLGGTFPNGTSGIHQVVVNVKTGA
jgi:DMSO/TMAO reductase YedYZ molybdopterin-dependent catalytic subunit